MRLPLSFLPEGETYYAYIYNDGTASQFDITLQQREVTSATTLSLNIRPNGGATVILSTNPDLPVMQTVGYEAESASGGTSADNTQCSKGKYKTRITEGRSVSFRNVKAETAGEYALTIYYMLPEDSRRAYIQVGDEGEKLYYDFHQRDDYDRSKGLVLGMKTVYVQLQEGLNRIYYGTETGTAPDLDKITITPTWATQQADGIQQPVVGPQQPDFDVQGSTVTVNSHTSTTLHVFSLDGRVLHAVTVPAGITQVSLHHLHGPVIVSQNAGVRSFARKIVLP